MLGFVRNEDYCPRKVIKLLPERFVEMCTLGRYTLCMFGGYRVYRWRIRRHYGSLECSILFFDDLVIIASFGLFRTEWPEIVGKYYVNKE